MSEQRETYGDQSIDDEDQLQPEDTLDDTDLNDVLDRGYSPPDRAPKGYDDYPTEAERLQGESLDEKLAEEEPDVDPYAEAEAEDDTDHEDENALDEQLGLDEADARTGRLVQPDEGEGPDIELPGARDRRRHRRRRCLRGGSGDAHHPRARAADGLSGLIPRCRAR